MCYKDMATIRSSSVVSCESLIECPIASRFFRCYACERYVCGGQGGESVKGSCP